jgi:ribosomal protein S19E (S16A)
MEDAMLIHRIMRAPEKRVFKIDVGNIPPREVEQFMQRIINKMKKTPVIDQNTGEYNLKYNVESVTEDYFLPVRGGDSGTEIDTLPGLSNNDQIDDIEYLRNKLMASLRIPKAFLGYEEGLSGGKATLAAEDVRFARTIERLQKIIVSELTKIGIVHLYSQGFTDADLINFTLELQNPSMIHEQEKIELMSQQLDIAEKAIDTKLFSRRWIYDNIFDLSDEQKINIFEAIVEDTKQKYRLEQIETEGQDPANAPPEEEDDDDDMARPGDWGGSEKDPFKDRDTMDDKYGHESLKDTDRSYGKRKFKGKSPLATSKASTAIAREGILDQLKNKFPNKNQSMLNEDNIIKE